MAILSGRRRFLADRVSDETLRAVTLLTGSRLGRIRNVRIVLNCEGRHVTLDVDDAGEVTVDEDEVGKQVSGDTSGQKPQTKHD